MKKVKISLLCALATSLVFAAASFAGTWEDNFDDGLADGWNEIDGEWKVEDGMYQRVDKVNIYGKSVNDLTDLADYTLEVDVTIVEKGPDSTSVAAGVLLRSNEDASSGYRIWLRDDTNGFQFSTWEDNAFTHVATQAEERAVPGQAHHLEVTVEGFMFSASVDGRVAFQDQVEPNGLFPSGRVAFINYNCHVKYDNLTISSDTIAAIAPGGKLAVTWGALKL
ncbi:family 16 glycoside hydrolase [Candidatus Poribacteria bacterium]